MNAKLEAARPQGQDMKPHGLGLRAAWAALRQANPRARARDVAERFGVSEAELIASGCGAGGNAVRLRLDVQALLEGLTAVGPVMALTRNDSVVHEKIGCYANVTVSAQVGQVLNHDIDLRLFPAHWVHAFAVTDTLEDGSRRQSLQVFDAAGTAVHKVFQKPETDAEAFAALASAFAHDDQSPLLAVEPVAPAKPDRPDAEIDTASLRAAWAAMKDTHEFFGMLRSHGAGRLQALQLVGEPYAVPVAPASIRRLLEAAASRQVPIMVFVGNPGCIQIHTGPIEQVKVMGPWLNVLDAGFNLHLREDHVAEAWIVRKPTSDGIVTSLELFDSARRNLAMLFGERKPGKAELPAWRTLVESMKDTAPVAAE